MSNVLQITEENFKNEVLDSGSVVLIDFYADWCGPCKMMHKTIEEIGQSASDKLKVCKANIENCSNIVSDYNISAVPSLLFFKDGKVIKRSIGLRSKNDIEQDIEGVNS